MNLNFIPQVFYDVIARIIPGSVLLWFSYLTYYGYYKCIEHAKLILKNDYGSSFLVVAEILLLGYIISIVLYGIWLKISQWVNKYFKKGNSSPIWRRNSDVTLEEDVKSVAITMKNYISIQNLNVPSTSFIYDLIRIKMPDVGARLVKIRAECHMCSVLFVGWVILLLMNIINFFEKPLLEAIVFEMLYIALSISIFIYLKYLEDRFLHSISNHWILFQLTKNEEI